MRKANEPPVTLTCETCGAGFAVRQALYAWHAARGTPPKYCSIKCSGAAKRTKVLVTLICEHCDGEFRLQQGHYNSRTKAAGHPPKYCSRSCMGAANGLPTYAKTCQHCGNEFIFQQGRKASGTPRKRGLLYCSTECRIAARSAAAESPDYPGFSRSTHLNADGYVVRKMLGARGSGRELEHRLVMERVLGRRLLPGEQPHHVNGDRSDNRPENLELWDISQPPGQRVEDKLSFYKEFVSRYGYAVIGRPVLDMDSDVIGSACFG